MLPQRLLSSFYPSTRPGHRRLVWTTMLFIIPICVWYWAVVLMEASDSAPSGVTKIGWELDPGELNQMSFNTYLKGSKTSLTALRFSSLHQAMDSIKMKDLRAVLNEEWNFKLNKQAFYRFRDTFQTEIAMSTYDNIMLTRDNTRIGPPEFLHPKNMTYITNQDLANVMKWLPKKSLMPPPPYKTCSVVGSGGILWKSSCGRQIDKADMVFRFNLAPTSGYEHDVGKKTSVTALNPVVVSIKNLQPKKALDKFITTLKTDRGLIWYPAYFSNIQKTERSLNIFKQIQEQGKNVTIALGGTAHYKSIDHVWTSLGIEKKISTGLYFITSAIFLCDQVHVYGFWPFPQSPDGRNITQFYYKHDNSRERYQSDWLNEIKAMTALHKMGLVNVHVGNCES